MIVDMHIIGMLDRSCVGSPLRSYTPPTSVGSFLKTIRHVLCKELGGRLRHPQALLSRPPAQIYMHATCLGMGHVFCPVSENYNNSTSIIYLLLLLLYSLDTALLDAYVLLSS